MTLWDRCYERIVDCLTPGEITFLLQEKVTSWVIGGLSDLFDTVGHFEKELVVGTLFKTHPLLKEVIGEDGDWGELGFGYFQCVGTPGDPAMNAALDKFFALLDEERTFWQHYTRRVNKALQELCGNDVAEFNPTETTYDRFLEHYKYVIGSPYPFADGGIQRAGGAASHERESLLVSEISQTIISSTPCDTTPRKRHGAAAKKSRVSKPRVHGSRTLATAIYEVLDNHRGKRFRSKELAEAVEEMGIPVSGSYDAINTSISKRMFPDEV